MAPTLAVLVVATFTDFRSRRIPNWLVFPYLLAGIAMAFAPKSWHGIGILHSLEGMGLGLLIFGFLAMMGGMGMGDVKLCAAIGAWVGPHQMIFALVLTGLAGGIMALGWALWAGFLGELFAGTGDLMFGWRKRGLKVNPERTLKNPKARKMPYAPAIALGTMLSFFAH